MTTHITAAILIIGNEILSGRTQDLNINFLAKELGSIGIILKTVRVIADDEQEIIEQVNFLRKNYDYLFTTGGIGPTHDDITALSVAKAFGLELVLDPVIKQAIISHYEKLQADENRLNAAMKMAYIPKGAKLVPNSVSNVPGFSVENVYVMAGIPKIMQGMFAAIKLLLPRGAIVESKSVSVYLGESILATRFAEIQNEYRDVEMGSYPFSNSTRWSTSLVLRSTDADRLNEAFTKVMDMIKAYDGEIIVGEVQSD